MQKVKSKPIQRIQFKKKLTDKEAEQLIANLKSRFHKNIQRHKHIGWGDIEKILKTNKDKLESLNAMESTGGEPDVIEIDEKASKYIFTDCSEQTPLRRNICYDRLGEIEREKGGVFPGGNAVDLSEKMGIELLTVEEYYKLQALGEFDTKTSSWLKTPEAIRKKGGAIYGDRRYGSVFIYHNGAQSFYSVRGFRGILRV